MAKCAGNWFVPFCLARPNQFMVLRRDIRLEPIRTKFSYIGSCWSEAFWHGDCSQHEADPYRVQQSEPCLRQAVHHSDHEKGDFESAYNRISTESAECIPITAQEYDCKEGQPCPPQVQVHLKITVMSLVGVPPMLAPDFFESRSHPETLEACPEKRVPVHNNNFAPEFCSACECG